MDHTELRSLQDHIKFDGRSMCLCLGVDYEQYRRFLSGHAAIPASVERAALELEAINVTFMEERYSPGGKFDQIAEALHPRGIISDCVFE